MTFPTDCYDPETLGLMARAFDAAWGEVEFALASNTFDPTGPPHADVREDHGSGPRRRERPRAPQGAGARGGRQGLLVPRARHKGAGAEEDGKLTSDEQVHFAGQEKACLGKAGRKSARQASAELT